MPGEAPILTLLSPDESKPREVDDAFKRLAKNRQAPLTSTIAAAISAASIGLQNLL
jgi:hypothetical protein